MRRPAEYLLRFDDLCPTMDRGRWERFVPLLERYGVKPILAVVPENRDPELCVAAEDPGFWEEMRGWQSRGAVIGLHGYRHLCVSEGGGLVPLHLRTEFAGVPVAIQGEWLRAGIAILRERGLEPQAWVAPRHGTDMGTARALAREGIGVVSDGLARRPYRLGGLTWIPQQIWRPEVRTEGLWTICLHANTAPDRLVGELEGFLERFAAQFTSVDRVLAEWPVGERSVEDRWYAAWVLARRRWRLFLDRR